MKFGDLLQGEVVELDAKGRGVVLYTLPQTTPTETRRVAVPFTAVGDEVEVRFIRRESGMWIGELTQVLRASADRVDALCPHAGVCGGCLWQHLDYAAQLRLKQDRIAKTFETAGIYLPAFTVHPSEKIFYYRNRMDYVFGWRGELGMKEYGSWNRYVDTSDCHLLDEETPKVLAFFRAFEKASELKAWDPKHETGELRYVVIRRGCFTNERMIMLLVKDATRITIAMREEIVRGLREYATSIILGENPEITDVSYAKTWTVLHGNETLQEEINGILYRIHLNSFFQTNSFMAGVLQNTVLDLLGTCKDKTILDLYCGLGFFGIACAKRGATVFGHELDAPAIALAKENAELNSVSERTTFSAGTVETYTWETDTPDLVIIDPPRAGLHPKALQTLMEKAPPVIIYVSCNYHRLVEELKTFTTVYRIEAMRALDLFPHTPHVELVVKLVRT